MKLHYLATASTFSSIAAAVDLTVASSGGHPFSPLGYGLIFEDINHSGDGGIYAELIQNRAFQNATIPPWTGVNGASLELGITNGVSAALPNYVTVAGGSGTGDIGLVNPGYWGIDVQPQTYTGKLHSNRSVCAASFLPTVRAPPQLPQLFGSCNARFMLV